MSPTAPFGTVFAPRMGVLRHDDGFGDVEVVDTAALSLHPATHALHYGSQCFEGLKAHRHRDGGVRLFRADRHVARMRTSLAAVHLPVPDAQLLDRLVTATVAANLDAVPDPPGSLYLRPTSIGTDANIGSAAHPSASSLTYVIASPVGDYFAGGVRPLRLVVQTSRGRTVADLGAVKCGANYLMALDPTLAARDGHGADQVLFAPGGRLEETGASNIALVDGARLVTPRFDGSFLQGVTRDSLLAIGRDLGYDVAEADLDVDDLVAWAAAGEVVLMGTAAVVSPVGELVVDGRAVTVAGGQVGPHALALRERLVGVQRGDVADTHGWLRQVSAQRVGS